MSLIAGWISGKFQFRARPDRFCSTRYPTSPGEFVPGTNGRVGSGGCTGPGCRTLVLNNYNGVLIHVVSCFRSKTTNVSNLAVSHFLRNSTSNINEDSAEQSDFEYKKLHPCYLGKEAKEKFYLTYNFIHGKLKAKVRM